MLILLSIVLGIVLALNVIFLTGEFGIVLFVGGVFGLLIYIAIMINRIEYEVMTKRNINNNLFSNTKLLESNLQKLEELKSHEILTNEEFEQKREFLLAKYQLNEDELIKQQELDKLQKVAGDDSIQFAEIQKDNWICVCGQKNTLDINKKIQNCSCGRNRDYVLENLTREKFNKLA